MIAPPVEKPQADQSLYMRVAQFLFHEAELLDARAWDAWGALFAPDGVYWVPTSATQTDPIEHVSLIHDTPLLREIRLRRLKNDDAASLQPGVESSHHVSNIVITALDENKRQCTVRSRLIVAQYASWGTTTFHARCTYGLLLEDGDANPAILSKRVDLLGAGGAFGDILTIL